MNRTSVPSKGKNDQEVKKSVSSKKGYNQKVNNPAPVMGQTIPNGNGLEMPPKTAKWGVSEKEIKAYEKQGELIISQVGTARINENNTLEMDNGNTLNMKNPKAYQNTVSAKNQRREMDEKAKQKEAKAGIDR